MIGSGRGPLALGLGVEEGADAYLRLVRSAYERYQRGKLKKAKRYSRQARRYAKRNPTHATSLLQDARRARHQARNPDSSWIRRYSPALRRLPRLLAAGGGCSSARRAQATCTSAGGSRAAPPSGTAEDGGSGH